MCDDSGVPGGVTAAFNELDRERWRRVGSEAGLDYHGGRRDERGNVRGSRADGGRHERARCERRVVRAEPGGRGLRVDAAPLGECDDEAPVFPGG